MARFLIFGTALFAFIRCGSTIICYDCNSVRNPQCSEDILPESLSRNCSELDRGMSHTLCRKIVQHVEHEINGFMPKSRVIRTCGWDDSKYKNSCYHRSGFGGRQEVCTCTTDYCNGCSITSFSAIIIPNIIMLIVKYII